jgi:GntR family transcriptional regulator/MocR family aminotransferase
MRALYAERQAKLIAALRGRSLALAPSAAGMHLVGGLPAWLDDAAIARAAAAAGIEAPALSAYYHGPPAARGLLLGYAGVPEAQMLPAALRLAAVIDGAGRA